MTNVAVRSGNASDSAWLTAVLSSLGDALCVLSSERRILFFNEAFASYWRGAFGEPPREGGLLEDLLSKSAESEVARFWIDFATRSLRGTKVMADAWHTVAGAKRYFGISSSPVLSGGELQGAAVSVRDLTYSRRRTQSELTELALTRIFSDASNIEGTLAQVLEFLCEADDWHFAILWLLDPDQALQPVATWNDIEDTDRFEKVIAEMRFTAGHGLPGRAMREREVIWVPDLSEETEGLRGSHALHLGFRGVVAVPIRKSREIVGVIELFTRDVRPMSDDTGRALHETGLAVGRLIERKEAEQERLRLVAALERKGTEWAATFDSIDAPMFLTTREGRVVRLNRAARDLIGLRYSEIVGRAIGELGSDELWTTIRDLVRAVVQGNSSCSGQATDRGGERHWDVSGSIYGAGDAAEDRVVIVLRDITTMITLQESVRRGEQLAAMGELLAGVAHEVRNPLFGMSATLDAYEPPLSSNAEAMEMVNALRTWLARLNRLMENLLEYGRTWNINLRPGHLEDVVEQSIAACEPLAARHEVSIVREAHVDPVLLMDPARLGEALQNLIMNAIQHSKPRTEVVVETRRGVRQGNVECSVRDSGSGFHEGDLPRIFEPFFTRRRGGTGLGLSIVQRVVEQHGGTVLAHNQPGGGAVVTMRFPEYWVEHQRGRV